MRQLQETQLVGGRSALEVVRVENTVRRPLGPRSDFTHALLKYLEGKQFSFAPRFLGVDEKGREILTFVEGEVPHGEMRWTDNQLIKIVKMMREFHDATTGSDLAGDKEVVCHNDIAPWNTVLQNNVPIALIDYDDAAPGKRVDDLAYAAWTFLGLGNDVSPEIQTSRMKKLCDAYGWANLPRLVDAVLEQQRKILMKRELLAKDAEKSEDRAFSVSRVVEIRSEIEWILANRSILERGI